MIFSDRTPRDLSHNAITRAVEDANGQIIIDLTQSNPTVCEFEYPAQLLAELASKESLRYDPQAFGLLKTREVLARHLTQQGRTVKAENLVLTASTSEAYSYLFKLFGNSGDSFLVPTPGYPLFDHLLRLEALEPIPYSFKVQSDWPVDLKVMEYAITPQTKGIIVVNPHNPTGAFLNEEDTKAILDLCEKHSLVYISDEVFADYVYQPRLSVSTNPKVLSFRLGGLSKSLGLPQLKLAWMEIAGPQEMVNECKNRLELIADTYLSVNTPVQVAIKSFLTFAPNIQNQIKARVLENRKALEEALKGLGSVKVWPAQGGWYALVEVLVEGANEEKLVIEILQKHQVLVHPGGFYDFPQGCFLVLSLLPQPEAFNTGVGRLRQFLEKLN